LKQTQWKKTADFVENIITLNDGLEFWASACSFEYWPSLPLGQGPLINKGKLVFISSSMSHYGWPVRGCFKDTRQRKQHIKSVWVPSVNQTLVKSKW